MVDRAGRYFGLPFTGYHGVTQGDLLSPTLFNMVVDSVIRDWVTVLVATKQGMEGLGLFIRDLAAYFYADDGLIGSTQLERLQRAFGVLAGIFSRVSFRTNTRKTVIMDCQTCHATGRILVEAYKRRTTGKIPTFWERH